MPVPVFPNFKLLTFGDYTEIQQVTDGFPPYSDFDFISLWAWDTEEAIQVSKLDGNIVFLMLDYLTKEKFLSFVGKTKIEETVAQLLQHSMNSGYGDKLKLLPKEVISLLHTDKKYAVLPDRDNFDYILHLPSMVNLKSRNNDSRRKNIKRFEEAHNHTISVQLVDIKKGHVQKDLLEFFDKWALKSKVPDNEIESERTALSRLFEIAKNFNIQTTVLLVNDVMVGFSVDEIAKNGFAVGHFQKANINFRGAFQYLDHQVNINLVEKGIEFLNIEQDMGIEALRIAKMGLHPHSFLEKFTIVPRR